MKMHGMKFTADLFLIPLGGCDMVLEIQWFHTLGKVLFDFINKTIEFQMHGRQVVLRGANEKDIKTVGEQSMLKVVQQASEQSMMQLYTGHKDNPLPNPQIHTISENPNPHPDIQTLLNRFGVVFQDPYTLPPFRPGFNHKIPLR